MSASRICTTINLTAALIFPLFMAGGAFAQSPKLSPDEVYSIARDGYLFAYPIVSMDLSMRQATNVPDAKSVNMRAPVNQFAHARAYPAADERDVVRYNFDTLYSFAWLDLAKEPIIVSTPDTDGRYYLLPMLDMWTDVFSVVGSRTTGTRAGSYAVAAPGWNGTLPDGVKRIDAPTSSVWIIGRTKTDGPGDYDNVHKVQDGYKLTPLSAWGSDYKSPSGGDVDTTVDDKTPPLIQVNKLDGVATMARLAELMAKYPPHPNDYPMMFRLEQLGLEPGQPFNPDPDTAAIINRAAQDMLTYLPEAMKTNGYIANNWNIGRDNIGTYGTSYRQRAIVTMAGLGANLPEDAVYPVAFVDGEGKPLHGNNEYVLHFAKGQLPPANAFWSITMYDKDGFQVPNALNRFAIGSYDKLVTNADGSLDIFLQADSPGEGKEANWLPAPEGEFQPTMRIYSPRPEVLDGRWTPPPITRVNE